MSQVVSTHSVKSILQSTDLNLVALSPQVTSLSGTDVSIHHAEASKSRLIEYIRGTVVLLAVVVCLEILIFLLCVSIMRPFGELYDR